MASPTTLELVDGTTEPVVDVTDQGSKDARAIAITRLVVSIITIANLALCAIGWSPLDLGDEVIYDLVSLIVALIANIWVWWKNNNVTRAAQEAQEILSQLKED